MLLSTVPDVANLANVRRLPLYLAGPQAQRLLRTAVVHPKLLSVTSEALP